MRWWRNLTIALVLGAAALAAAQSIIKSDQGRPGNHGAWPVRATQGPAADGGSAWGVNIIDLPYTTRGVFGGLAVLPETPVVHLDFADNYVHPELTTTVLDGGGYAVADGGRLFLGLVATANGIAALQSRATAHYIPGQGMMARFTFVQTPCKFNQQTEIGVGVETDGFFFGCCPSCAVDGGTSFAILRRAAGVNYWTPASQWNGEWGTTAPDTAYGRPYQIEFQWLGYGRIIYSIEGDAGIYVPAHTIYYAGTSTEVSVRDPTFPLRVAIRQFGDAGTGSISSPSLGLYRQGMPEENGEARRGASGAAAMNTSTQVPVLSLRNNTTFNGVDNRHSMHLDFISWNTSGNANSDTTITLWRNTGLYGSPSFVNFSANSYAAIDTSASGVDAGGVRMMTFQSAANTSESISLRDYHITLVPGDVITITGIALASTPSLRVSISWTDGF